MLVKHMGQQAVNPWDSAHFGPTIEASYRRGVLRAKVSVSDLTSTSARISTMESIKPGTALWLTLPGLEARHVVVEWSAGFTAGLRFDAPLHPAVLDAVIEGRTARYH